MLDRPKEPFYTIDPTVFAHVKSPVKRKATQDLARYERSTAAKKRKEECSFRQEAAMVNEYKEDSTLTEVWLYRIALWILRKGNRSEGKEGTVDVQTMTDTSGEDIVKLQESCQLWREENSLLKASCGPSLTEESLQNDDAKVKFYT